MPERPERFDYVSAIRNMDRDDMRVLNWGNNMARGMGARFIGPARFDAPPMSTWREASEAEAPPAVTKAMRTPRTEHHAKPGEDYPVAGFGARVWRWLSSWRTGK